MIALVPRGRRRGATRSRVEAEAVRDRLWRESQQGSRLPPTMENLVGQFAKWNSLRATPRIVRQNQSRVRRFLRDAKIGRPDQITREAIQAYVHGLIDAGRAPRTQIKYRSAISRFCRFLQLENWLDENPASRVECQRPYDPPPRYLDDAEQAAFLAAVAQAPDWLRLASLIAYHCGLRMSEIRALCWGDVRPGGLVVGGSRRTKSGRWRTVPLPRGLATELETRRQGPTASVIEAHSEDRWKKAFGRMVAGLSGFGAGKAWHLLRATRAVEWARQGQTIFEIMALGGWASPGVVMRYVNIARAAGKAEGAI